MIFDNKDCCLERDGNRFRFRVGAVIIENGRVLLATNAHADYYYSIGGGVHIGETSEQAVLREVKEETGVDHEIDRLAFVHENFFSGDTTRALKGLVCHEISFYYLMRPRWTLELDSDSRCPDGKEILEWIPLGDLCKIKVFPDFYKSMLQPVPSGVTHIVTK